jgi:hypothetical protein
MNMPEAMHYWVEAEVIMLTVSGVLVLVQNVLDLVDDSCHIEGCLLCCCLSGVLG